MIDVLKRLAQKALGAHFVDDAVNRVARAVEALG